MSNKVDLPPPPNVIRDANSPVWKKWFSSLFERVGTGPFLLQGYAAADVPDARVWANNTAGQAFSSLIYVYDDADAAGLYILAYSNGTNWIRVDNGATIS